MAVLAAGLGSFVCKRAQNVSPCLARRQTALLEEREKNKGRERERGRDNERGIMELAWDARRERSSAAACT